MWPTVDRRSLGCLQGRGLLDQFEKRVMRQSIQRPECLNIHRIINDIVLNRFKLVWHLGRTRWLQAHRFKQTIDPRLNLRFCGIQDRKAIDLIATLNP